MFVCFDCRRYPSDSDKVREKVTTTNFFPQKQLQNDHRVSISAAQDDHDDDGKLHFGIIVNVPGYRQDINYLNNG